jgi:hypothetical protein
MCEMIIHFSSGCGQSSNPSAELAKLYRPQPFKDVTLSPEYNFSSFTGTVWKTKVKVAVADLKLYTGAYETILLPPMYFDVTHPQYTSRPEKHILAVLPPGMRLRIGRLMQDQGAGGRVQVEAVLEDGTNAQKAVYLDPQLLAENRWARGFTPNTNWGVNPDMLEAAETASSRRKD